MMKVSNKYLGITLDPVHIGTGGYRLGGVDNTIIREPSTDIPKIPGTSLAGVMREFATVYKMETDNNCKSKATVEEKRECAKEIIRQYFGDENKQGMLRFYDGQIIFFPVSSIQGTVWIVTKELLEYWLGEVRGTDSKKIKIPQDIEDKVYAIKGINDLTSINLGWLLLEIENINDGKDIILPSEIKDFLKKIVIVSDKLFSHIINDNLEVRTSVRINPLTGTSAEKALFTYEAIPRGTIYGFEIVVDTRRDDKSDVDSLIEATFPYLKLLGLGGLGTRGFGRVKIFKLSNTNNQS